MSHTAIGFDRVRISKEESFRVSDIAAVQEAGEDRRKRKPTNT